MPHSYPATHPFLHLTRILAALQEARRVRTLGTPGPDLIPVRDAARDEVRVDHDADLEGLSLSRRGPDRERPDLALEWVSLSRPEGVSPDEYADLGSASLSLRRPDRPDH